MSGEFLELASNPALEMKVRSRVVQILGQSFMKDGARQTQDEVRRRFKILENLIRTLRTDCGWAYDRILDELPRALRAKLDGAPWEPDKRTIWSPGAA